MALPGLQIERLAYLRMTGTLPMLVQVMQAQKTITAFMGEGSTRALLRSMDWSNFPMGQPETWSTQITTALQIMLDSKTPSCLAWGPELHLFYNDAYIEVLGERHPAALAHRFWDVWSALRPDFGPAVERALEGTSVLEKNIPFELTRHGAAEKAWFNFSLLPVREENGRVAGIFNVMMETTAQIEAEQSDRFLLTLTDRLRPLEAPEEITAVASEMLGRQLQASRVFFSEVDDQQGTFFIRSNWLRNGLVSVAGRTRKLDDFGPDVIATLHSGRPVVVNDISQDPRTAQHAEAYQGINLRAYMVIPLIKAGHLISLLSVHSDVPRHWSRMDLHLSEQLIERTWAVAANATAQAELREAVRKLKEADAHKDEFLAMLAHELRNPLAPIRSAADLLMGAKLTQDDVLDASQIIGRQVDHMTSLIEDLLDVSRVTRGLAKLEKTVLDMQHIVKDAVEQVSPLIRSRHHHLVLHLSPDVTAVMGDEKRLIQVVANLLNNAAKYTPPGGKLLLKTEIQEGRILLSVTDNGIGMTAELATRVFDLFAQAERSSDRSSGGLGLGLALVKSLVELHGGSVTCASDGPGRGSTFTVSLPQLATAAVAALPRREPTAISLAPASHTLRVMVVDDNVDAAQMLGKLLQISGYEVMVEHAGPQALERARSSPPDVCLLDIGLPGISGIELAGLFRQQPHTAGAVLIAVTGYCQAHEREFALASGFDHYFVKPVDTKKLLALLEHISADLKLHRRLAPEG
jgi:signal transduction histidine kinase/ActR/RegA family two-component response regulator